MASKSRGYSASYDIVARYIKESRHEILKKNDDLAIAREYAQARFAIVGIIRQLSPTQRRRIFPPGFTPETAPGKWTFLALTHACVRFRDILRSYPTSARLRLFAQELKLLHLRLHAARDRLVTCNLRMVIKFAKAYRSRSLSYLDLIQEGNEGLLQAVDTFDHTKNNRFTTYAMHGVSQRMLRAFAHQTRPVRLPVHKYEALLRYRKEQADADRARGRTASPMGTTIALQTIELLEMANRPPASLDDPDFSLSASATLKHLTSSLRSADDEVAHRELHAELESAIESLDDPREKLVIRMRFGIGYDREYLLDEIGVVLGVSRERVRQLESQALVKMRRRSPRGLRELAS